MVSFSGEFEADEVNTLKVTLLCWRSYRVRDRGSEVQRRRRSRSRSNSRRDSRMSHRSRSRSRDRRSRSRDRMSRLQGRRSRSRDRGRLGGSYVNRDSAARYRSGRLSTGWERSRTTRSRSRSRSESKLRTRTSRWVYVLQNCNIFCRYEYVSHTLNIDEYM